MERFEQLTEDQERAAMNPKSTGVRVSYEIHVQVFEHRIDPALVGKVVPVSKPAGPIEFVVYPRLSRDDATAVLDSAHRVLRARGVR